MIIIKPGDRVNITPYNFPLEGRNPPKSGIVFSQIDDEWFRIFVSHGGVTDMFDCPRHVLVKESQ